MNRFQPAVAEAATTGTNEVENVDETKLFIYVGKLKVCMILWCLSCPLMKGINKTLGLLQKMLVEQGFISEVQNKRTNTDDNDGQ